ncbi:hypothetical protein [Anaerocolumna sedimenticola]|uniref:hypothetical protein n=1 Tax=Anaerocolumna sedimenticola TaxID=2696063 RepID=UPI001FE79575|nr:hypothetical protein [Anaerocolumna sedimenticola]
MLDHKISDGEVICDFGSVQGLTSVFLAKEYGFTVYTTDLWSDPVSCDAEVTSVHEMESNDEVWADWLKQDNELCHWRPQGIGSRWRKISKLYCDYAQKKE